MTQTETKTADATIETTNRVISTAEDTNKTIPTEELIEDLLTFAEMYDRPYTEEKYNEHGSHSIEAIYGRFGNWTTAKKRVGIAGDTRAILQSISALRETVKGNLTEEDYLNDGEFSPRKVKSYCGSWASAKTLAQVFSETNPQTDFEHQLYERDLLAYLDVRLLRHLEDAAVETGSPVEKSNPRVLKKHLKYDKKVYSQQFGSIKRAKDALISLNAYLEGTLSAGDLTVELRQLAKNPVFDSPSEDIRQRGEYPYCLYVAEFGSVAEAARRARIDIREL